MSPMRNSAFVVPARPEKSRARPMQMVEHPLMVKIRQGFRPGQAHQSRNRLRCGKAPTLDIGALLRRGRGSHSDADDGPNQCSSCGSALAMCPRKPEGESQAVRCGRARSSQSGYAESASRPARAHSPAGRLQLPASAFSIAGRISLSIWLFVIGPTCLWTMTPLPSTTKVSGTP